MAIDEPSIPDPRPNLPLLRKVLEHIDAHPDEWNQANWGQEVENSCGTAFCIAGHALVMSGYGVQRVEDSLELDFVDPKTGNRVSPYNEAIDLLGITLREASCFDGLFAPGNTRADVQRHAERIAARAGERL